MRNNEQAHEKTRNFARTFFNLSKYKNKAAISDKYLSTSTLIANSTIKPNFLMPKFQLCEENRR